MRTATVFAAIALALELLASRPYTRFASRSPIAITHARNVTRSIGSATCSWLPLAMLSSHGICFFHTTGNRFHIMKACENNICMRHASRTAHPPSAECACLHVVITVLSGLQITVTPFHWSLRAPLRSSITTPYLRHACTSLFETVRSRCRVDACDVGANETHEVATDITDAASDGTARRNCTPRKCTANASTVHDVRDILTLYDALYPSSSCIPI